MIAGGLVIFISGLSLLQGKLARGRAVDQKVRKEAMDSSDIAFSPMAMPMLAGPGSISLLISLHSEYPDWTNRLIIIGVIVCASLIVYVHLRFSNLFFKILGEAGIRGVSRIMGFIVMAIGVQYVLNGVKSLL